MISSDKPWTLELMEQNTFKNVSNCLNTNISTYLETPGNQSTNLYLNVVHFFNTSVNGKESTVNRALGGSTYPG
jgi:hypothetical protein